jgi:transcriptional regulator with XRE-family HTH domain
MNVAGSLSNQADQESASTYSIVKQQVLNNLQGSREYREAFIEESIQSRLTAQINTLRVKEGWDLKTFSEKLGKKLSWAYRLEDPNAPVPTIPTLLEVAATFDIGLDVRFRRYSELLDDVVSLTPASLSVPSFEAEVKAGSFDGRKCKRRARNPHRKSKALPLKPRRRGIMTGADNFARQYAA